MRKACGRDGAAPQAGGVSGEAAGGIVGSTMAHSVAAQRLTKRYGAHVAVDDVSLRIARGRFVTLLGPSGSGKTTILMSIAGFVQPDAGDILLDDRVITHLPPERRDFGMVFQGYALFPHMTVEDNVWFPLRVRGIGRSAARARVAEALELVRMGPYSRRLPGQLSGGQQQRVALARALVFRPNLLLMDEPLSALDKKLRGELQVELRALHRQLGATFVYVTHDQDEALSMSDDVVILHQGRIEQSGAPRELYDRPASRFVAGFLGRCNLLAGTVADRGADRFVYTVGGQGFVQAGAPGPLAADGRVLIGLRPEKIVLAPARPAEANTIEARILDVGFHGADYDIRLDAGPLGEMAVTAPVWRCGIEPAPGVAVWLGWAPDASTVLREG
jgi:putative spermidine/putrescine transport system ATP-binding protein